MTRRVAKTAAVAMRALAGCTPPTVLEPHADVQVRMAASADRFD